MTFQEMFNSYISYRKESDYKVVEPKELKRFHRFMLKQQGDKIFLCQDIINEWFLQTKTETKRSYHARVYPIVSFLKYAIQRGYSDVSIPKIIKNPPYQATPHVFTDAELANFFKACDEYQIPQNALKDKLKKLAVPVLFRLMFATGMRPCECRYLSTESVDLANGVITIHESKGYRERKIPIHSSTKEMLCKYDKAVSSLIPNRKVFFPTQHDCFYGKGWISMNFTRFWYKYNKARAVSYDFRHNFAIRNINSWINVESDIHSLMVALSKYMGHREFVSTMYYYSLVPRLGHTI